MHFQIMRLPQFKSSVTKLFAMIHGWTVTSVMIHLYVKYADDKSIYLEKESK